MKKNKAMKLVRALRSGEYNQGTGRLVDGGDNFCCLGVACNISTSTLGWKRRKDGRWYIGGDWGDLPRSIMREYGFNTQKGTRIDGAPIIIEGKVYACLAHANDLGATFVQIADYIENNYKEL